MGATWWGVQPGEMRVRLISHQRFIAEISSPEYYVENRYQIATLIQA